MTTSDELYLQAAQASRNGQRAAARRLLLQAAELAHADSHYTLATMDLQGLECPKDAAAACDRLRHAAALGSNLGRRLLATLTAAGYGTTKDWAAATRLLIDAGEAGDREALREVGLLIEMAVPGADMSEALLVQAAGAGDGLAVAALLRRSLERPVSIARDRLQAWCSALLRVGHPIAHQLREAGRAGQRSCGSVVWERAREILSVMPERAYTPTTVSAGQPFVVTAEGFATVEECDYVIGKTAPMLRPSAVIDERTGRSQLHAVRTSSNATLWPIDQDLVVHCLNVRAAAFADTDSDHAEMLSVLCYQPGQQYLPHFDFLSEGAADAREMARAGQRTRTVLIYLNDDYTGGETHFLVSDLRVKGKTGSAMLFHNTTRDGQPDVSTRHAGLAVTRGTKWLGSKWFRARKFEP